MRYLVLCFLVLFGLSGLARAAEIPEVSLIELIGSPDKFDGKRVKVVGTAEIEFEGTSFTH
jgi:hypothetical protein